MSFEGRLCPECGGNGIHNDGDTYTSCWRCCGMGILDDGLLDEDDTEVLVGDDDNTSLTEPANLLFVEDKEVDDEE